MITTKEIKIKVPEKLTSEYIENEFTSMNLNVLRWAITGFNDEFYTLSVAVVE